MGIFDKAKDALDDNPDQVDGGLDQAADYAEDPGPHHPSQMDSSADTAKADDYVGSRSEAESIPDPTQANAPPVGSPEPPD
ncbi:MAG: hypothetical protein K0S98_2005 [Propionibacteriaceae bacterium]|nr:hypothetical protein [Propionibacteriaceae bacterium]